MTAKEVATNQNLGAYVSALWALEADNQRLREALEECRREHYICDGDCWYSCPKSGHCCNDNAGNKCTCGADIINEIIDSALNEKLPEELEKMFGKTEI